MTPPYKTLLFLASLSGLCFAEQSLITVTTADVATTDDWKAVSIQVANHSQYPVTALRVVSTCMPKAGSGHINKVGRIDDPLVRSHSPSDIVIAPEGSAEYELGGAPAPFADWSCTGAVAAALFANGESYGDPAIVERLRRNRVVIATEVSWYVGLLSDAVKQGHNREVVFGQMDARQSENRKSLDKTDFSAGDQVYSEVLSNLKNMHTPDNRALPDNARLEIMLSVLQQWQGRFATALQTTK